MMFSKIFSRIFRFSFCVLLFCLSAVPAVSATEVVTSSGAAAHRQNDINRGYVIKLTGNESLEFQCLSPPRYGDLVRSTIHLTSGGKYEGQRFGKIAFVKVKDAALGGGLFVLNDVSFKKAVLEQSSFTNIFFVNADFSHAVLTDAFLCVDEQCRFDNAVLNVAYINSGTETLPYGAARIFGMTAGQLTATQSYKNKNLAKCQFYSSVFDKTDFSGFRMRRIEFLAKRTFTDEAGGGGFADYFYSCHSDKRLMYDATKPAAWQRPYPRSFYNFLTYCNFTGADLREASFASTDLEACNFTKANLRKARFLNEINWQGVNFTDADIDGAEFWNISRPLLESTASYKKKKLIGIKLRDSDLRGISFANMNLTGSRFANLNENKENDFTDVNFDGAIITNCVFYFAYDKDRGSGPAGLTAEQIKSTWNYKNGRMDSVVLPPAIERQLGIKKEDSK